MSTVTCATSVKVRTDTLTNVALYVDHRADDCALPEASVWRGARYVRRCSFKHCSSKHFYSDQGRGSHVSAGAQSLKAWSCVRIAA